MHRFRHDSTADDRLIAGRLASHEDAAVSALVGTLRLPGLADELSDEDPIVQMVRTACRESGPPIPLRGSRMKGRRRVGVAAVTVGAALVATTGLASAGALPGAAQSTASVALSRVGLHVPAQSGNPGARPDRHGHSGSHHSTTGHGRAVSTLARTTPETGRDKGAAVSALASGGKSHAGNPPGGSRTHHVPRGHRHTAHGRPHRGAHGHPHRDGKPNQGRMRHLRHRLEHRPHGRHLRPHSHGAATSHPGKGHSRAGSHNAGSHRHHH
jgi:hypothetical protein